MSLDSFKSFVKANPSLINYVRSNEMTWQGFYEIFDLYGPDNSVWNKYIKDAVSTSSSNTFKDILSMFKNMDMSEVQKGISSLQKGINYVQDLISEKTLNNTRNEENKTYEPRPIHKYFDD